MRLAAALLALTLSLDAHALSCLAPGAEVVLPDVDELPTNPQLLVLQATSPGLSTYELRSAGDVVPLDLDVRDGHGTLTPVRELLPEEVYAVWALGGVAEEARELGTLPITGAMVDTEPPEPTPLLRAERKRKRDIWGGSAFIDAIADDVFEAERFEWELALTDDFSDAWRVATLEPEARLGHQLCSTNFPDYDHQQRYFVRVRAVDAAGNPSGWSDSGGTVRGCSTSVGNPGAALAVPLMLLPLFRRRIA